MQVFIVVVVFLFVFAVLYSECRTHRLIPLRQCFVMSVVCLKPNGNKQQRDSERVFLGREKNGQNSGKGVAAFQI